MLEELNLYSVKVDIKVQWNDMDASQQVNSTRYFNWLEIARVEYFIRLGLDMIDNDDEPGTFLTLNCLWKTSPHAAMILQLYLSLLYYMKEAIINSAS